MLLLEPALGMLWVAFIAKGWRHMNSRQRIETSMTGPGSAKDAPGREGCSRLSAYLPVLLFLGLTNRARIAKAGLAIAVAVGILLERGPRSAAHRESGRGV